MIDRNCLICDKKFSVKKYLIVSGKGGKYCSRKCYHQSGVGKPPWNKGIVGWKKRKLGGNFITCIHCGNVKYFLPNQLKKRACIYCSVICARKHERHDVLTKYSSIHARIKSDWGYADICDDCGSKSFVDWANIDDRYTLDRNTWKKLCRKCHIRFDKNKKR